MSQGWQKHFRFGQAKYSAGIMHICGGCKAADYLHKPLHTVKMKGYFNPSLVTIVAAQWPPLWQAKNVHTSAAYFDPNSIIDL